MEEISTEQKLQLVQQIRSQNHKNRYDMNHREQILYGRTSGMAEPLSYGNSYHEKNYQEEHLVNTGEVNNAVTASESLKFRCALAAMLFIFVIVFDLFGVKPLGLEMEQIFTYIAADYQEDVQEFVETMTNKNIGQ